MAGQQKTLAGPETNPEAARKELERLHKERAELEEKLRDLAALRAQIAKLKNELATARRLEWIRKGLFGTAPSSEVTNPLSTYTNRSSQAGSSNYDSKFPDVNSGRRTLPPKAKQ
jgi:hypothetical protein